MQELKSNCCQKQLTTNCGDEGTCYWICKGCGKAADQYVKKRGNKLFAEFANIDIGKRAEWLENLSKKSFSAGKEEAKKEILEKVIEKMKNHNEMIEMSGIKYTEGFEKALSNFIEINK